jgi:hypothetical protein
LRNIPGWRHLTVLFLLGLPCAATYADDQLIAHDILFVGNSFTYYNNGLSTHYRKLVQSAYPDATGTGRIRMMTISGGRLSEHLAGLAFMLDESDWDIVVLQGYSNGPIGETTAENFRVAAREAAASIRADGAEPVFFMTWAYSDMPQMTAQLDVAYSAIGEELGAKVVPVGLAFSRVTMERPAIGLRIEDKKHPTLAGTYLAACVFYAVLTQRSPEGLPYNAGLPADVAAYLQRVAQEVTSTADPRAHRDRGWSDSGVWLSPEAKAGVIQVLNKHITDPNRTIFSNVFVNALGE